MIWSKIKKITKKTLETIILQSINITIILLVLNLISNNLGIIENKLATLYSFYLLLGLLILNLPLNKSCLLKNNRIKKINLNLLFGIFLIIFSFIILFNTTNQMLQLSSIPLFLSGIIQLRKNKQLQKNQLYELTIGTTIYTIFFIILQTISPIWHILSQISSGFTNIIGILIKQPITLGPTISGLWIILSFGIIIRSTCLISQKKKEQLKHTLISLLELLLCWIIYILIFSTINFESKQNTTDYIWILFIFCLLPTLYFLIKKQSSNITLTMPTIKGIKLKQIIRNTIVWSIIFLFISTILLTSHISLINKEIKDEPTVLFYGQNMLGTWDIPSYGKYGREATGMFGLMPIYLSNSGFKTQIMVGDKQIFHNQTQIENENITKYVNLTDYTTLIESKTITQEILSKVDILVIINLNTTFSEIENKIIWEYVEDGGSLLVLGDHTDVGGIQDPLNDLIKPIDVQFRFDSALPLDQKNQWLNSYQLPNHPITSKIKSMSELQISVGASLDTSWSSQPLIIGQYGLSDIGNRSNEEIAFLGDYEYNKDEKLGDLILVTSTNYGNGKIIVFGDTSSFQNSALPNSYHLISDVFSWLTFDSSPTFNFTQTILAFVFLAVAFILFFSNKNRQGELIFFSITICIALITTTISNPYLIPDINPSGNAVYIDLTHNEQFNLNPYTDDSLSGLTINLMRNNFQPIILRDFSTKIMDSKIIVFNAPTKAFSSNEITSIKQYMNAGGFIILCTGYYDKEASMPILDIFDLDIEEIPLGPVPYVEDNPQEFENETRFVDSWPILFSDNSNIRSFYNFTFPGWSDYHLIVFAQYGKGGLLLIGDSQFLLDKNIESIYDYWPGNILFLKHLIDELQSMEVER